MLNSQLIRVLAGIAKLMSRAAVRNDTIGGTTTTMAQLNPERALAALVERTRKVAQNLLAFTTEPEAYTRDKGTYFYVLARPAKRLASALSSDRELLVLFTTFEEQQQRTVKTARDLIARYGGRLESALAIIVHSDEAGNEKLAKWGRSVGLAVLPIYSKSMPNDAEGLERHLCHQLFSHDPFDVTGPVSEDHQFFGRRNEAADLARKLQDGQIRSCLGIRKIGKTSNIHRVIRDARSSHECFCIMMDCSRDLVWSLDADQLMIALAEAVDVAQSTTDKYAVVTAPTKLATLSDASTFLLTAIQKAKDPVLIFVDEVDYITPGSPTARHWAESFNPFWRNFRSVYQEALRQNKKVSIMVCGVSSKWFSVGTIEGIENAALAFIPEEYLSPLSRSATVAMIKKIARTAGLGFTDETAGIVAAACSDMPFWVRKACSFIHRQIEVTGRPITLGTGAVKGHVADFIAQEGATLAQVAVGHLFRVFPELETASLSCLNGKNCSPTPYISVLRQYGVLTGTEPVRPSGEMIRQALVLHREQRETAESALQLPLGIATETKDRTALDDWAENLAIISKERNLLEKKLRQLVLNFIRANTLATRKKGTTRERLLMSVQPKRKDKLSKLEPDELVEELLWTELTATVVREWTLFADVFADRKQFEEHTNVVNVRYDAHAKDADAFDIASYRRSLKWIRTRIASI
jgi:hypothetical protein